MKKILSITILYSLLVPYNNFIYATSDSNIQQDITSSSNMTLNIALSYLQGQSQEFVYHNGKTLSQLDWKIQHAPILRLGLGYDFFSSYTISLNTWFTISEGRAVMDDYDWLIHGQSFPSDWSHHEHTDLKHAYDIDINLTKWFIQNERYKLGLRGGYEITAFNFLAKGGYFEYDNGAITGYIPPSYKSISYEQQFGRFYLGLSGRYFYNDFEFGTN